MFGVLLASLSQFFTEVSSSIIKDRGQRDESLLYVLGFLQYIWGTLIFLGIILVKEGAFVFALASLPTFLLRAVLEIFQSHFTLLAIIRADRSSFSFVRVLTVPFLLLADLILAYSVKTTQLAGIGLIVACLLLIFAGKHVKKHGIGIVIFVALNAVATISLFKYNISNFNSVAAEQLFIGIIIIIYFLAVILFVQRRNPVNFLRNPVYLGQSFASAIGTILDSFAYVFAPASVILTAKRGSAVLWSTISGNVYFKEANLLFKLFISAMLVSGIILLAI